MRPGRCSLEDVAGEIVRVSGEVIHREKSHYRLISVDHCQPTLMPFLHEAGGFHAVLVVEAGFRVMMAAG